MMTPKASRRVAAATAFARFASLTSILVGCLVLLGWMLDIALFKSLLPGLVAMKVNTALGFILAGGALWFLQEDADGSDEDTKRRLAWICASLVLLLGLLTLGEDLLGWDLGIDNWLLREPANAVETSSPGRMAPTTALGFLLLASALLLLDVETRRGFRPAQFLALVVVLTGALTSVGYLYYVFGGWAAFRVGPHTQMALHTALAFVLVAAGVLCARPEHGVMVTVLSEGVGGTLMRRLLPAAIGIPILLGWLRWAGQKAGLYGPEFGLSLLIISWIGLFGIIVFWYANSLDRSDRERRLAVDSFRHANEKLTMEMSERSRIDRALARTNRALKTLSEINQAMVRATEERAWLDEVCRLLVATGGYRLAWIGYAEADEKKTVRPVAQAGYEAGYLETVNITWADTERGRGPTGTAIRTGQPAIARNIPTEPDFEPWRAEASKRGYASSAAFPLIVDGRTLGSIQVYAADPDAFDEEEVNLLTELAGDIAYGLHTLRTRAARQQAEEALAQSEERIRMLVDAVEDYAIFMLDPAGRVVSWNQGAERIKGYRAVEIIGQNFSCFYAPEDLARARPQQELTIAAQEGRIEVEGWRVRKDGSRFWANAILTALRDDAGNLRGFAKVTRDLTERKQAEEQILRQNALLEGVNRLLRETLTPETEADVARTCLAVAEELTTSQFGFISELNAAGRLDTLAISDPGWEACRIPADRVRMLLNDVEPRGIRARLLREDQAMILNDPTSHPDWIGIPEGHPSITSFLGVPVQRQGRRVLIGLANKKEAYTSLDQQAIETLSLAFLEALERKRAEREIKQLNASLERRVGERTTELVAANKELEAFTYSVSHDLRAPLRQIHGFAQMLLEEHRAALPEEAQHWLDRVSEGTRHMGRLVDDLLNLTRVGRQEVKRQVTGLNSLVREALEELQTETQGREIEWRIDSLPFVECDPMLMKLVFQNLLSNALKFTRPRKPAVIELGCASSEDGPIVFVRDNGVGFSMKYAEKLFGVFQRLHRAEDFEGTGVGLATVQRIIHKHSGQIWAEAELDRGATFYFYLGAPEEAGARPETMAVQGGVK